MILQALTGYYEALCAKGLIASPGWDKIKVAYGLEIQEDGTLVGVIPLKVPSADGKKMLLREMELPARVKRSVNVSPNFLCDTATYLLGIGDTNKPERVHDCFAAAKAHHLQALAQTKSEFSNAICRYFSNWQAQSARENPILLPYIEELESGVNLVFFYKNQFPQEDAQIRAAWQAQYDGEEEGETMRCLVTGKKAVPAATHPAIKGVNGAQPAGAALVSFNAPAYCSYGREQNLNAPVSKSAAFAYTTVLNRLLADKSHVKRIGDMSVVYWAEEPQAEYQDLFASMLDGENQDISNRDLNQAMRALAEGNPIDWEGVSLKPNNRFFVLGLSPNAARLSVRFFIADRLGGIAKNVKTHYERINIVSDNRNRFTDIPLWALLRETVNENARDKSASPQMAGDTLRAIITGGNYPATLYQQCQLRIHADRTVTRGRAAIIKAYLLKNTSNLNDREALTVELNESTVYQPYVLGRLFAVLEEVQEKASGVTTIKDKYFNSACATPAVVFPMILKLGEIHRRKLDNPGQRIEYAKQVGGLTCRITTSYPMHHNLYDQGIFQLGYYHQTQKRYQKKHTAEKVKGENE